MLLITLLLVLAVGVLCFFIGHVAGRRNLRQPPPATVSRPRRNRIESDLDDLLRAYNQGMVNEQEYIKKSDQLIDQLSDLLHHQPPGR